MNFFAKVVIKLCAISLFFLTFPVQAQWISINQDGASPDSSAALDISSNSRGVLIPRMSSVERLTITNPAQGLLVFQNNGLIGFYYYDGVAWDTLGGASSVTNISNITNVNDSKIAVLLDKKASNVDGGTFSDGAWRKRDLNSATGDLSFISLDSSSSEFTLSDGTYLIEAKAPGYNVDQHQIRLYNNTLGSVISVGSMALSGNLSSATTSFLTIVVTVSSGTETFTLEHRCDATNVGDGFGLSSNWGDNVFSQITIQKL